MIELLQIKSLLNLCLLFWLLALTSATVSAQVLIVHPDNTDTELSRTKVRSIFAMRSQQWSNGSPVKVFVLADNNPLHTAFCKHILGMFAHQLRRIWDRQTYSGTGVAPTIVHSEQEMIKRVAQTKGAIGYVSSDVVNLTVKKVKDPQ